MFFVVSGFCFSALFIQLLSGLPGKWRKIKVDMEFYEYSLVTAGNLKTRRRRAGGFHIRSILRPYQSVGNVVSSRNSIVEERGRIENEKTNCTLEYTGLADVGGQKRLK